MKISPHSSPALSAAGRTDHSPGSKTPGASLAPSSPSREGSPAAVVRISSAARALLSSDADHGGGTRFAAADGLARASARARSGLPGALGQPGSHPGTAARLEATNPYDLYKEGEFILYRGDSGRSGGAPGREDTPSEAASRATGAEVATQTEPSAPTRVESGRYDFYNTGE